jgi:hypothetical protein
MRCLRTVRYKYIRSFADRPLTLPAHVDPGPTKDLLRDRGFFAQMRPPEMLFDLERDPLEQSNLAGDPDHASVLVELRDRLERWMVETDDPLRHGDMPAPLGATVTPVDSYEPTVVPID